MKVRIEQSMTGESRIVITASSDSESGAESYALDHIYRDWKGKNVIANGILPFGVNTNNVYKLIFSMENIDEDSEKNDIQDALKDPSKQTAIILSSEIKKEHCIINLEESIRDLLKLKEVNKNSIQFAKSFRDSPNQLLEVMSKIVYDTDFNKTALKSFDEFFKRVMESIFMELDYLDDSNFNIFRFIRENSIGGKFITYSDEKAANIFRYIKRDSNLMSYYMNLSEKLDEKIIDVNASIKAKKKCSLYKKLTKEMFNFKNPIDLIEVLNKEYGVE